MILSSADFTPSLVRKRLRLDLFARDSKMAWGEVGRDPSRSGDQNDPRPAGISPESGHVWGVTFKAIPKAISYVPFSRFSKFSRGTTSNKTPGDHERGNRKRRFLWPCCLPSIAGSSHRRSRSRRDAASVFFKANGTDTNYQPCWGVPERAM